MERHYFLGGNTPLGFYSYYDSLIQQRTAKKVYVIKGGPGTGKSTLMKKTARWAKTQGLSADLLHCSSDPDSLDGVVFSEIGIAMVDGTAPHVVDPKNPGCVDTILHLGAFWNETAMRSEKAQVLSLNREISMCFARAYRYLAAAGAYDSDISFICDCALSDAAVRDAAAKLVGSPLPLPGKTGDLRKLFLDAITPKGVLNFADTFGYPAVRTVKAEVCGGGDKVLARIAAYYIERGYDVEGFYDPLAPKTRLLHLCVPSEGDFYTTQPAGETALDLAAYLSPDVLQKEQDALSLAKAERARALDFAVSALKTAKALHDELEQCYVPHMDFAAIDAYQQTVLADIQKFL